MFSALRKLRNCESSYIKTHLKKNKNCLPNCILQAPFSRALYFPFHPIIPGTRGSTSQCICLFYSSAFCLLAVSKQIFAARCQVTWGLISSADRIFYMCGVEEDESLEWGRRGWGWAGLHTPASETGADCKIMKRGTGTTLLPEHV